MANKQAVTAGTLVKALKGRDAGSYFITLGTADAEGYVLIADGKTRKLSRPKRKRLKHVRISDTVLKTIAQKLSSGANLTDKELYRAIKAAAQELTAQRD